MRTLLHTWPSPTILYQLTTDDTELQKQATGVMFWGVKLECGKQYSQLVEKSFHISHAALQVESHGYLFPNGTYEVHAIVEKTDYVLCYLGVGWSDSSQSVAPVLTIQQQLNLNISEGEEIILYVKKTGIPEKEQTSVVGSVYLTGYFVEEPTFAPNLDELLEDDEHLLDDDSDDNDDDLHGDDLEGQGSDLDEQSLTTLLLEGSLNDSDSDEDFMADMETPVERSTRKRLAQPPVIDEIKEGDQTPVESTPPSKRQRSSGAEGEVPTLSAEPTKAKAKKKKKKKKECNTNNQEDGTLETTAGSNGKAVTPKSKKKKELGSFKTLGGTEVQDLKIGSGKIAKPGTKVFVKYTGRLAHNQKIFDSNITQKKPFMFRLGQGEVIKGWDEGVNGMRIGGKRKLLIPPKQGYGSSGALPDIPPNSKLLFDVELVDVK